MIALEQIREIAKPSSSKIVLLVIDGLGGLAHPETGKTELETARTPNLDRLAREGICGLAEPVSPGIIPGSAPAHLALFGYDPVKYIIGRGVLEALGIDFDLREGDVAARGNFCTIDAEGRIIDRRAGRISTQKCAELCRLLDGREVDGVQILVAPVKEHRFVAVFRGDALSAELNDSDPQQTGVPPHTVLPLAAGAERSATVVNKFLAQAKEALASAQPANMVLLRGFSRHPHLPLMGEIYKLRPAAVAAYPMYRGLAKLVGMTVLETGAAIEDVFITLERHYADFDFFFLHVKQTDSAGEDGDFERKVRAIEEVDAALPRLLRLAPEVIVVSGDHSTPALLKGHSWHPVPFLLYSRWCRPDGVTEFSETACAEGVLGRFPSLETMPLAMANALKFTKFGA
jgi:2,3-bisphosphoglycerate-independent phosphoglycerate mutase